MPEGYDVVIGLEIHAQLATRTKMFCGCENEYGAEPNTRVCPICLGLPGTLPVVNVTAVELGIAAALGLGAAVHKVSVFARKNYFYPDLPKGYQITQYDRPLATDGSLDVPGSKGQAEAGTDGGSGAGREPDLDAASAPAAVRIRRVHLEEDSGRSLHDRVPDRTALDFNRSGVPLIEVVTEPDLRSPADARAFLVELKRLLRWLGVSDCDMETGSLRVDANLSLRPSGSETFGTKTEVKNLNSFSNVERALTWEANRQAQLLGSGGGVVHETLLWDVDRGEARPMRSKEESHDYRYFPEPDLPPLVLGDDRIAAVRGSLPELPADRQRRFRQSYSLPAYDAGVLTADRDTADWFEAAARASDDPKAASNWLMGSVAAWLNARGLGITDFPVTPAGLGELIRMVAAGTLSNSAAATVLEKMAESGRSAGEIVEAEGLAQVSDDDQLHQWLEEALAAHPEEAARLGAGESKLVGFFVGKVMAASGGKADPARTSELLRARSGEADS